MKRLSCHIDEIKKRISSRRGILLLADFDGTLAPIVSDPADAALPADVKRALASLQKDGNVRIAVVTGRALPDIVKKAPIKDAIFAANHGLEIFHKGRFILNLGKKFKKPLARIADTLSGVEDIPGAIVERKGLSTAVHYRKVRKSLHGEVKRLVGHICRGRLRKNGLKLLSGKMILEIRPANFWNKGKASLWIWKKFEPSFFPIFVGDDTTDEDAFRALRKKGLTIRIGKSRSSRAEYYAKDVWEVIRGIK